MQLKGQVKSLLTHGCEKKLLFRGVLEHIRFTSISTYTLRGRNDNHTINRRWPVFKESGMPIFCQQHNFSLWICSAQRLQRGKRENEIAKAISAQHGNFAHTGNDLLFT